MHQWVVTKQGEARLKSGHPWLFSNELAESPKGIAPGDLVAIRSPGGKALGWGYGHPNALIAFRLMSRGDADRADPSALLGERLEAAARARASLGFAAVSHRLVFAEADRLPGLVVDRYVAPEGQVFVAEASTAGMAAILGEGQGLVRACARAAKALGVEDGEIAVVLRTGGRGEEVEEAETKVVAAIDGLDAGAVTARFRPASGTDPVAMTVDLLGGQKTGFFLDQWANVQSLCAVLPAASFGGDPVRVLDLFCYVGQWSTQLARHFAAAGRRVETELVDASEAALALARTNAEAAGADVTLKRRDIVKAPDVAEPKSKDIVIVDPPALIQKKRDVGPGSRAYQKVTEAALRTVKPGGVIVLCSCSHHLSAEDFGGLIAGAEKKAECAVRWWGPGHQSPDHPLRFGFPQGRYLKAWFGLVEDR